MKKFVVMMISAMFCLLFANKGTCMSYTDAVNSSKPAVVMIYADWADDVQDIEKIFQKMDQKYVNKLNFVMLNIADKETKEFNKKFYIYPNLPYILLLRDGGKVSRYLKKDCAMSRSCMEEKIKFFIN